MKWIIVLVLVTALIAGCTQPVPNQNKNLTETGENASKTIQEPESTQFRVEFARNVQNVIKVGIRNTGNEGNIYLEKIKVYVDTEAKTITNIVGMKSNVTIEPVEAATFDVIGVNNPCNKLIKIVLSSGLEDGRRVSC